jgi:ATP-dependent Lon protease
MSPMSAESTVVRNYLDWLLSIPWGKAKTKPINLTSRAHPRRGPLRPGEGEGADPEYLAVQSRTGSLKGPILCLVGPPGVGKTSLGRSIAKATGPRVRAAVAGRRA